MQSRAGRSNLDSDGHCRVHAGVSGHRCFEKDDERGCLGPGRRSVHHSRHTRLHPLDNCSEFAAQQVRDWLEKVGAMTVIELGSPRGERPSSPSLASCVTSC